MRLTTSSSSTLNNLRRIVLSGGPGSDLIHPRAWLRIVVPSSWLQLARRTDRPWLGLVVVPILMAAAVLTLHLWLLPVLIACCWWWASTDDPWAFVLGILEAAWGVQWGAIGLYLLAAYPNNLVTVVAIWFGYAFAMAGIGAVNRFRFHRKYGL